MILAVVLMFNAFRQPLVIWLTAPLAIIGVTVGLLLFRVPFEFMAILGFLSLIGMLVKNSIVLVDQADAEIRDGQEPYGAVVDAAVSRARPVFLGALTTILGVAPLLLDPFFKSMAVTIMFGLAFATLLTLVVVPLLYAALFRMPEGIIPATPRGPVAQWLEQGTHNPLVPGSSPGGPTKLFKGLGFYAGRRRDWNPLVWGIAISPPMRGRSELVESRVRNLIGFDLGRSVEHRRQELRDFWIGLLAIGFRAFLAVP
jgi:hypothetical protein